MDALKEKCIVDIDTSIFFNGNYRLSTSLTFVEDKPSGSYSAVVNKHDLIGEKMDLMRKIPTNIPKIQRGYTHQGDSVYNILGYWYVALKSGEEYYPKMGEKFLLNGIPASIENNRDCDCYEFVINAMGGETIKPIFLTSRINRIGRNSYPVHGISNRLINLSHEHILITLDKQLHFRNISKTAGIFVMKHNYQFGIRDNPIIKISNLLNLRIKFESNAEIETLLGPEFTSNDDIDTLPPTKVIFECEKFDLDIQFTKIITSNDGDAKEKRAGISIMEPINITSCLNINQSSHKINMDQMTTQEKTEESIQIVSPFD